MAKSDVFPHFSKKKFENQNFFWAHPVGLVELLLLVPHMTPSLNVYGL